MVKDKGSVARAELTNVEKRERWLLPLECSTCPGVIMMCAYCDATRRDAFDLSGYSCLRFDGPFSTNYGSNLLFTF